MMIPAMNPRKITNRGMASTIRNGTTSSRPLRLTSCSRRTVTANCGTNSSTATSSANTPLRPPAEQQVDHPGHRLGDHNEQEEDPELRPRGAALELGIFLERTQR